MMTSGLNNGESKTDNMSTPLKIMWSFQPLKHTPSTTAISQFQLTADLVYCSWFQFGSYTLVIQKTVSEGPQKWTSIGKVITRFLCPALRPTACRPSDRCRKFNFLLLVCLSEIAIVSQLSKCLKFMTFREGCFVIRN